MPDDGVEHWVRPASPGAQTWTVSLPALPAEVGFKRIGQRVNIDTDGHLIVRGGYFELSVVHRGTVIKNHMMGQVRPISAPHGAGRARRRQACVILGYVHNVRCVFAAGLPQLHSLVAGHAVLALQRVASLTPCLCLHAVRPGFCVNLQGAGALKCQTLAL